MKRRRPARRYRQDEAAVPAPTAGADGRRVADLDDLRHQHASFRAWRGHELDLFGAPADEITVVEGLQADRIIDAANVEARRILAEARRHATVLLASPDAAAESPWHGLGDHIERVLGDADDRARHLATSTDAQVAVALERLAAERRRLDQYRRRLAEVAHLLLADVAGGPDLRGDLDRLDPTRVAGRPITAPDAAPSPSTAAPSVIDLRGCDRWPGP
ncbi:hypothetical protein [Aquihabitans sp. McL0605]|uniref:hypothetical protein n=1 Tax=Aquihabitans sp. McL0605 TaxID=3415671 RepID=UPI003CF26EA2